MILKTAYSESSLKTHFRKKDANGRNFRERIINSKTYRYYADEGKLVGSVWNDIKSCLLYTSPSPRDRG